MSNAIKCLNALYNNPFIFGPVFHSFYKELKNKDRSLLLSYIVLPLSLYPASQSYLIKRKSTKSCFRILLKEHSRIWGLQERIEEYKLITNITMQHALDISVFNISSNLSINVVSDWPTGFVAPPNASNAAQRLGEYISSYDVPTIYHYLGIKKI